MTGASAPVYELTLEVGAGFDGDIDAELRSIADADPAPGVADIRIYRPDEDASRTRVVTIHFESEAQLRRFQDEYADWLDGLLRQSFGEDAGIRARPLLGETANTAISRCLNCDSVLTGQYCGQCGQRAQSRLISTWELVRDAFGDLFELDSRLWQTLVPLAVRPGLLTREYLRGRRARFMPPFRMYLVLSLAFFVIAFFDPYRELSILFEEPPPEAPVAEPRATEGQEGDAELPAADEPAGADAGDEGPRVMVQFGDEPQDISDCDLSDYNPDEMPGWLARRLTRERVQAVCEDVFLEGGRGWQPVIDRFVENIPAGLFVLLPLMAFVLKLLYPLSRRYYVEHLLFVVHYHAFVFLILTAEILFTRLLALLHLPEAVGDFTGLLATIYIPVYLYKGQRRVYEQGHWLTIPKFLILVFTYFAGLMAIVLAAGLVAAFSA